MNIWPCPEATALLAAVGRCCCLAAQLVPFDAKHDWNVEQCSPPAKAGRNSALMAETQGPRPPTRPDVPLLFEEKRSQVKDASWCLWPR